MTANNYRRTDVHGERKSDERDAAKAEREKLLARKALETSGKRIVYAVQS